MSTEQSLMERSGSCCELCTDSQQLSAYLIPPDNEDHPDKAILLCQNCLQQVTGSSPLRANHWRCLNDSMWSPTPAVQVMAWRQLNALSDEPWAQDLLEMLYLDEELLAWAKATNTNAEDADERTAFDSNGAALEAGDTVTLIKDLVVKGAGFTAKRGTAVRNIGLTDNPDQIEGRVNGTRIVLLTKFLKKSN